MLYLISGASRSGKTIIAKQASARMGIPYLSLDWIMMGFTNGIPEYGIHDKLFPDEIAKRLWSFLKAMFENMIYAETDCIIEGEALLPELIEELLQKYPDQIKVCFVGFTEVEIENKVRDIRKHSVGKNDWLNNESEDYITDHVKNMITHSKMIEESCQEYQMRYFDTSHDFLKSLDVVLNYILNSN